VLCESNGDGEDEDISDNCVNEVVSSSVEVNVDQVLDNNTVLDEDEELVK
jgi:hypothetical protein